jgi:DNA-binding MarR family transcriptional regulator
MDQGLGTRVRHLLDLLDGAVAEAYAREGLNWRPRYTPVMRALLAAEPRTVGEIADAAGITQPAATQTVSLMIRDGLVSSAAGATDARRRMIRLTPAGRAIVPRLQACWGATAAAAAGLDAELAHPLAQALAEAIAALERKSFAERLAEARTRKPA